jgi:hypothetical protein
MTEHYGYYQPPHFNDRRSGKERRKFLYTVHIPERRTGKERRLCSERRKTPRQIITIPLRGYKSNAFDIFS